MIAFSGLGRMGGAIAGRMRQAGHESTTNRIGNGTLALLRFPDQMLKMREDPSLVPSAVEEFLRFEAPIHYVQRQSSEDLEIGGKRVRKGQMVSLMLGAANRDPQRFPDPDRLDICRQDNRHVAFAWASHFCFGAPLARVEGQVAFETVLRRMPHLKLQPSPIIWRANLGLRGLTALHVTF